MKLSTETHALRAGLIFAVLAAVLLVPIWWGADGRYGWDVDNIAPGSILRAMAAHFGPSWAPTYGPLPYALGAIVYAPILVAFKLLGELGQPSMVYPWGFAHPTFAVTVLVIAARLISVAMAMGIVALAMRENHRDAGHEARWVTPVSLIGSAVFVYYARSSNVDIQYLFWLWLGFHLVEHPAPRLRRLLGAVAAATLAVCTKEQSAPLSVVIMGAAVARAGSGERGGARLFAAVAVVATAALTYAAVWRLPWAAAGWIQHHDFIFNEARNPRHEPFSTGGLLRLAGRGLKWLPLVLGPLLTFGLVSGIAWPRAWRGLGLRAIGCLLYSIGFIGAVGYVYPRFLLPILLIAVPATARVVCALLRIRPSPVVAPATATAVIVLALLGGPALSVLMLTDPRLDAERWLRRNLAHKQLVEVAGNPHYQPRIPATLSVLATQPEELRKTGRDPLGDVVLISSEDGYLFLDSPIREQWLKKLHAEYDEAARFAPPEVAWLIRGTPGGLPVAPLITVYKRPAGSPHVAGPNHQQGKRSP